MGTPFANTVAGDGGALVLASIHSPNFVHGSAGWSINQDGTAEFQAVFIPPGSGGATVYIQATAPTTHNVGDLWFDSSNGFKLNQWTGTRWQPFQYGTQALLTGGVNADRLVANSITAAQIAAATITATQIAAGTITGSNIAAGTITAANIAAGTITAALLSAGIVVAGIVDGTTITGAQIVADGTSGEILVYSGTPAAKNLIASVSGAAGTDSHSNAFDEGIGVYDYVTNLLFGLLSAGQLTLGPTSGGGNAQVVLTWNNLSLLGVAGRSMLTATVIDTSTTFEAVADLIAPESGGAPATLNVYGYQPTGAVIEPGQVNIGGGGSVFASYGASSAGYPVITDSNGSQQQVSGSKLAAVNTANVTTTANSSLGFFGVPASDVSVGSSFQGHASGSFSTGASVPTSATFKVYWGGITGTVIASLAVPSIPASASGLGWWIDFEANWMAIGNGTAEVEVTLKVGWHTLAGVSNSVVYHVVANTSSLNTTIAQNLSMAFQWGSAPGGQQLLCDVSRVGRVA